MKIQKIIISIVTLLFLVGVVYVGLKNNIFADVNSAVVNVYVAPNGDDNNSGAINSPLKTLSKAKEKVKTLKSSNQPIVVNLRQGSYLMSEPFSLSKDDSGSSGAAITYQSYPGERATLTTGQILATNWSKFKENIYVTDIDPSIASFNSLFVDWQRATRARTANNDAFSLTRYDAVIGNEGKTQFAYSPGDVSSSWTNVRDMQVVSLERWLSMRYYLNSIDNQKVTIVGTNPKEWSKSTDHPERVGFYSNYCSSPYLCNSRFYIDNVFEALDSQNEWYFNKGTHKLYYYPKSGTDIGASHFVVPTGNKLVDIDSSSYVNIKDLDFAYTDWNVARDGYMSGQAGRVGMSDPGININSSSHVSITGSNFSNLGGYAIADRFSKNLIISKNKFYDLGSGGVMVKNDDLANTNPAEGREISDNTIHDVGKVFADGGIGIAVFQSGNNHVANNNIFNTTYSGMSIGLNWSFKDSVQKNNLVEGNIVHDAMQLLDDGGGIYSNGRQDGTIYRNNIIYNILDTKIHKQVFANGIYMDNGSLGITVKNNLIYNVAGMGLGLMLFQNSKAQNNVVYNPGRESGQICGPAADHSSGSFIDRNIVFAKNGVQNMYNTTSSFCGLPAHSDYNLFDNRTSSSSQLSTLKTKGLDVHSTVAAAQFEDPDPTSSLNFCLKPESLAVTQLGFVNFSNCKIPKTTVKYGLAGPSIDVKYSRGSITEYNFPSGFSTLAVSKANPTVLLSSQGLTVYKFDGPNNKWLTTPKDSFIIEPSLAYYVYNPSATKKVSLLSSNKAIGSYVAIRGWNMLYAAASKQMPTLQLSMNGASNTVVYWQKQKKINEKIFIIDNTTAKDSCSYFSLLDTTDTAASCPTSLKRQKTIPAGKAFWVYVK